MLLLRLKSNFLQVVCWCFVIILFFAHQVCWSRSSISELEARLDGIENKLDSNLNFELSSKIEFLQKEIQELRGTIEEQQHLISNLTSVNNHKEIVSNQTKINLKNNILQQDQAAYNAAYKLIEDQNFPEAIVAFKDFLSQFHDSKYSPNATYWLGDLFLTDHKLDIAANYFLQVVDKYKEHDKAPDALLKLGMLELERENWQAARNYFLKIKKDYSNSSRVHMADAKLKSLDRDAN